MPLRTLNNPLAESALLPALAAILLSGTQLAAGSSSGTGAELLYIQSKYAMLQGPFPAMLLATGQQSYSRNSRSSYTGKIAVGCEYYDRWDKQLFTIDTIRQDIALDLERVKANIETFLRINRGFVVSSVTYPVSLISAEMTGYTKALDTDVVGAVLGYRCLTVTFGILPYSV